MNAWWIPCATLAALGVVGLAVAMLATRQWGK
jgi:hypothetical protein